MSMSKGSSVTEALAWWKGLAKELELDIEKINDVPEKNKQY